MMASSVRTGGGGEGADLPEVNGAGALNMVTNTTNQELKFQITLKPLDQHDEV